MKTCQCPGFVLSELSPPSLPACPQAEMARVKAAAKQKDDYFTNFATQLFR
jgi:hypothetical protein